MAIAVKLSPLRQGQAAIQRAVGDGAADRERIEQLEAGTADVGAQLSTMSVAVARLEAADACRSGGCGFNCEGCRTNACPRDCASRHSQGWGLRN